MSHEEKSAPVDDFEQKLERLRLRIDLLPAEHRPRLYDLADTIAAQHRRLKERDSRTHDAR